MRAKTGHKTSVVINTTPIAACVTNINIGEFTRPALEIACIEQDDLIKIRGDSFDGQNIVITFLVDADAIPDLDNVQGTLTITFKDGSTFVASGFASSVNFGTLAVNTVVEGTLTFTLDGVDVEPEFSSAP